MILEVKKFPESQEVMDNPEWFLIMDTDPNDNKLGQGSYARILEEYADEEIYEDGELNQQQAEQKIIRMWVNGEIELVRHLYYPPKLTKSDDCMITYQDPGDENES